MQKALEACGYLLWKFKQVIQKQHKEKKVKVKTSDTQYKGQVMIPYIEGVFEVDRGMQKTSHNDSNTTSHHTKEAVSPPQR